MISAGRVIWEKSLYGVGKNSLLGGGNLGLMGKSSDDNLGNIRNGGSEIKHKVWKSASP